MRERERVCVCEGERVGWGGGAKARCTHILELQRHKPSHVRTQTSENNDGSKTLTSEWWEGQEKERERERGGGGRKGKKKKKKKKEEKNVRGWSLGAWGWWWGVRKAFQYNLHKASRAPVSGPGRQTY